MGSGLSPYANGSGLSWNGIGSTSDGLASGGGLARAEPSARQVTIVRRNMVEGADCWLGGHFYTHPGWATQVFCDELETPTHPLLVREGA